MVEKKLFAPRDYRDYKLSFDAKDAATLLVVSEKEAISCSSHYSTRSASVKQRSTGHHGDNATYHGYNTIINNHYLYASMEKAREGDLLLSEKEGGKANTTS